MYATTRYKNTLTKYVPTDHKERLLQEMAIWMKSMDVAEFWKEMKRKGTLRTLEATYFQIINKLLTTDVQNLPKSIDTNTDYDLPTATPETAPVSTPAALELDCLLEAMLLQGLLPTLPLPSTNQDNTRGSNDSEWTFNGTNVTNLFRQYQHKITIQVADKSSFQAESSLQETLALSNILFLAPNQHSDLKVQVFGCQIVDSLCHATINRFMDNLEVDFSTQEVSDLAVIVDDIQTRKKLTIDAQLDLLLKAKTMGPVKAAVYVVLQIYNIIKDITEYREEYQEHIQKLKKEKHNVIGYARKLRERSLVDKLFVSVCSNANHPISERDVKVDKKIIEKLDVDGNTQVLDYAGLTTDPNDLKNFLEANKNIEKVIVDNLPQNNKIEIFERKEILNNPSRLEVFRCRANTLSYLPH
ncbi:hypothetical protein G6F37_002019 [Rhizopus arrhizus]|nr:hypothetical protein G6F38_004277 [Rhizopus arrhizus]KAG1162577.1 hypothetical protein G6F37_002019 [Rhizopus arrhizus]